MAGLGARIDRYRRPGEFEDCSALSVRHLTRYVLSRRNMRSQSPIAPAWRKNKNGRMAAVCFKFI
jgi:hypothetical protein